MAFLSIYQPLSFSFPMVAVSLQSSIALPCTSIQKPHTTAVLTTSCCNHAGFFLRRSQRRNLQVVRMAAEEEKTTRRSLSDFPSEGVKGKEQKWTEEGSITESLPNGMFRIQLDNAGMVLGYISGKIRQSFIRILPGDRVRVEVNRYDSSKVRIVYRLRDKSSKE